MRKKSVILAFMFVTLLARVVAIDVEDESLSSTLTRVSVNSANNLFGFEVNFSINSGTVTNPSSSSFYPNLTAGASSHSEGGNQRNSYLYVYQSRLDSTRTGISGDFYLFNVTHSSGANLTLRGATFIYSDNSIEHKSYNVPEGVCGNSVEENGEDCDDGNTNNGDGCSSTCENEVSINNDNTAGGSGGTASSNTTNKTQTREFTYRENRNIEVEPNEFNLNIVQGVAAERELMITYTGLVPIDIELSAEGDIVNGISFSEESFRLYPNQPMKIFFRLTVNERGVQTGSILLTEGNTISKKVPIVSNVKSENFLFDLALEIPKKYESVQQGENVLVQIGLTQIGPQLKVDTTTSYVIKDFEGNIYDQQTETFSVLGEKQYTKEFSTIELKPGKYVLGLEVLYPGAFATSSAQFNVRENGPLGVGTLGLVILTAAIIVILVSLIALIWGLKKRKEMKKKKVMR